MYTFPFLILYCQTLWLVFVKLVKISMLMGVGSKEGVKGEGFEEVLDKGGGLPQKGGNYQHSWQRSPNHHPLFYEDHPYIA